MKHIENEFEFDVFVSYRWAEPDQTWVRDALVPALESAGVKVCLDINDFIPGRDVILEMTRAGTSSRRALCILSEDYFADDRMVQFESLYARLRDPGGRNSRLVPLVLRPTSLPDWLRGLIPIQWTDIKGRPREWRKLLKLLEAPSESSPPGGPEVAAAPKLSAPVFVHDYNLPHTFVARSDELKRIAGLVTGSDGESTTPVNVVSVIAIGGVGKSCLCRALLERPEIASSFLRVIWFSFYEARAETENYFFGEVLRHGFQWKDRETPLEGSKEDVRLRRELAQVLDRERTLLVLDGLEVIQFTEDPISAKYGQIKPRWGEIDKLLRHLLNRASSVCLLTSRVPLRALEPTRGYHQISLDLFTPPDGAQLLRTLGVAGESSRLEACALNLGGHALSLVAAGRFMARRKISAGRLIDLVGDPDLFRQTAEGEKVKRICEWYRTELNDDQEYFLTRLSLHDRSVSVANFPAIILGYKGPSRDRETEEQVIHPLIERGLVDRIEGSDSVVRYSAHPLMKLSYSTWLEAEERKRAHEDWARAAAAAPGIFFQVKAARSLEELQPLVDATEQYLAAENWKEAWKIYSDRDLGTRLGQLGYFELSMALARQFEEIRLLNSDWTASESVLLFDSLAWLANRLGKDEDELNYRRLELDAARSGVVLELAEVEAIVADALVSRGYVVEAAQIRQNDAKTRGVIALAQGRYVQAAKILRAASKHRTGHNRSVILQPLAEALYRDGKPGEAAEVLAEGLTIATKNGFTCCQRSILWQLTNLALRHDDLPQAQEWWEMYKELERRLELDSEENSWLLLAQGDFEGALEAAETKARPTPSAMINRYISRARVLLQVGDIPGATSELAAAERLQSSSGFKRFKNDLGELRKKLVARRSAQRTATYTN